MYKYLLCMVLSVCIGCSCSLDVNNKPVKPKVYKVTSQGQSWITNNYWVGENAITFDVNGKTNRVSSPYVVEEQ